MVLISVESTKAQKKKIRNGKWWKHWNSDWERMSCLIFSPQVVVGAAVVLVAAVVVAAAVQILGNLPLQQFEVVHLVGCAIIQDTPEEWNCCKGECARFPHTRSGLKFKPEPFSCEDTELIQLYFHASWNVDANLYNCEIRERFQFQEWDVTHETDQ